MLGKKSTATHPQSRSQSANSLHRGTVFFTLSPSQGHLSTSTWIHIPTNNNRLVHNSVLSCIDISHVENNWGFKSDDGDSFLQCHITAVFSHLFKQTTKELTLKLICKKNIKLQVLLLFFTFLAMQLWDHSWCVTIRWGMQTEELEVRKHQINYFLATFILFLHAIAFQ